MKYLTNSDDNMGVQSVPDSIRSQLLESLGYPTAEVVEEGTAGAAVRGPDTNIGQDAQDKLEEKSKKKRRWSGARKGDKSKTRPGDKDYEDDDDDDNGDPRAFGGKKGDKSKTHKGKDFEKESQEPDDNPSLYEWDSSVFVLGEEVYEIDDELFVVAEELDSDTTQDLDESHADLFINTVEFDEAAYNLADVYDYDGGSYIKMDAAIAVLEPEEAQ